MAVVMAAKRVVSWGLMLVAPMAGKWAAAMVGVLVVVTVVWMVVTKVDWMVDS